MTGQFLVGIMAHQHPSENRARPVTAAGYSRLKSGSFLMSSGNNMRTTMLYQATVS
jgi:hypothetical protein